MSQSFTTVSILGAGPAGLYAAILLRKGFPDASVVVHERNPQRATFGFGVVFSDRALDFMQSDVPELLDLIRPDMQQWSDMQLSLPTRDVKLDGVGFSAVGRMQLLSRLEQYAVSLGVKIKYESEISDIGELRTDLIIGADGIQSRVRDSDIETFQPALSYFNNHFAWFGVALPFETLTQTFIETNLGPMNAHHYRYSSSMSTFIVECEPRTWKAYGFDGMDERQSADTCGALFANTLKNTPLITNHSHWRRFPRLWCKRWVSGNRVLLGDAAHSAHFSIGSGTRLAMEDAIALVRAIREEKDLPSGLAAYERNRQPIAEKITNAANRSAEWYDAFAEKMKMPPLDFAKDYLMRSGRIDLPQLRKMAPQFMAEYDHRAR